MAGRFLPQKDVDLLTRISKELVGDKKNNKDGIINQEVIQKWCSNELSNQRI